MSICLLRYELINSINKYNQRSDSYHHIDTTNFPTINGRVHEDHIAYIMNKVDNVTRKELILFMDFAQLDAAHQACGTSNMEELVTSLNTTATKEWKILNALSKTPNPEELLSEDVKDYMRHDYTFAEKILAILDLQGTNSALQKGRVVALNLQRNYLAIVSDTDPHHELITNVLSGKIAFGKDEALVFLGYPNLKQIATRYMASHADEFSKEELLKQIDEPSIRRAVKNKYCNRVLTIANFDESLEMALFLGENISGYMQHIIEQTKLCLPSYRSALKDITFWLPKCYINESQVLINISEFLHSKNIETIYRLAIEQGNDQLKEQCFAWCKENAATLQERRIDLDNNDLMELIYEDYSFSSELELNSWLLKPAYDCYKKHFLNQIESAANEIALKAILNRFRVQLYCKNDPIFHYQLHEAACVWYKKHVESSPRDYDMHFCISLDSESDNEPIIVKANKNQLIERSDYFRTLLTGPFREARCLGEEAIHLGTHDIECEKTYFEYLASQTADGVENVDYINESYLRAGHLLVAACKYQDSKLLKLMMGYQLKNLQHIPEIDLKKIRSMYPFITEEIPKYWSTRSTNEIIKSFFFHRDPKKLIHELAKASSDFKFTTKNDTPQYSHFRELPVHNTTTCDLSQFLPTTVLYLLSMTRIEQNDNGELIAIHFNNLLADEIVGEEFYDGWKTITLDPDYQPVEQDTKLEDVSSLLLPELKQQCQNSDPKSIKFINALFEGSPIATDDTLVHREEDYPYISSKIINMAWDTFSVIFITALFSAIFTLLPFIISYSVTTIVVCSLILGLPTILSLGFAIVSSFKKPRHYSSLFHSLNSIPELLETMTLNQMLETKKIIGEEKFNKSFCIAFGNTDFTNNDNDNPEYIRNAIKEMSYDNTRGDAQKMLLLLKLQEFEYNTNQLLYELIKKTSFAHSMNDPMFRKALKPLLERHNSNQRIKNLLRSYYPEYQDTDPSQI